MSSHSPEIHDQRETQDGYLDVQRWIREQPDDLILKLNMIVHGADKAIDLRKKNVNPSVRFLVHYLHHLHEKGELGLFEEIYKEYLDRPTVKTVSPPVSDEPVISVSTFVDHKIPHVEKIISNFDSCCSLPQIDTITRLESLLAKLQSACTAYDFSMPAILTQLNSILNRLKQTLYSCEEAKKEKKSHEKELQDLEQELETANRKYKRACQVSIKVNRKKKVTKKDKEHIEEVVIKAKFTVEELTTQLKKLRKKIEADETEQRRKDVLVQLRGINGVEIRQELKTLTDSLAQEKAKRKARAEAKIAVEEKKRKANEQAQREAEERKREEAEKTKTAAEKRLPVPIHGASVVYLCIEHEHAKHGKSGDALVAACAKDFADALVHSQSVDFDDHPPADAGVLGRLIHKLGSKIPEVRRQTANDILSEFPFLNGLTVDSDSHAIEEHMDKKPMVKIEDILQLIGYLRFEATAKRDQGSKEGVGRQDLKALLDFIRNLEHIVIKRLTDGAFSQISPNVKPYKRAADIADNFFLNSVAVKKHLKSLPKRNNEKKEGGVIDTIRNFIKDAANTVGQPNPKDGHVVSTLKDALRRVAGIEAGGAEKATHESEHP